MDAVKWAGAYVQVVSELIYSAGYTNLRRNASSVYGRLSDLMVLKKYVAKPLEFCVTLAERRLSQGQSLSPLNKGLKLIAKEMSDVAILAEAIKIPPFKFSNLEEALPVGKWVIDVVKASAFLGGLLFPSFFLKTTSPLASRVASAVTSHYVGVALAAMNVYANWEPLESLRSSLGGRNYSKIPKILKIGMHSSVGVMAACAIFPNNRLLGLLKVAASGSAIMHGILLDCSVYKR